MPADIRPILSLFVVVFTFFCFPAALRAQYEGCFDVRGMPVYSQAALDLQDVAMAVIVPPNPQGQPVIYYNPNYLSRFTPLTRRWWYMHECGHHALGHAFRNIPLQQEQEADCFAIVTLVRQGGYGWAHVQQVQAELSQIGPGDWQHLPGPVRGFNLVWCLQAAGLALDGSAISANGVRLGR